MAIDISALALSVGHALDIATRHAAARLGALITHFAAVQGMTAEAAAEQLGALAVREVVSLVAEGTAEQAKALMMPHDLPAPAAGAPHPPKASAPASSGEPEASASGSDAPIDGQTDSDSKTPENDGSKLPNLTPGA